jgi:hypothetical protein
MIARFWRTFGLTLPCFRPVLLAALKRIGLANHTDGEPTGFFAPTGESDM